ncbi:MAG: response regulator, partial [Desulfobulbaceae bacterium]|nr:response regulator [Desulfobulbaceae bacterium]
MPETSAVKILVAEDNPVLRKSISSYLRKKGYQVLKAGDGAEALELFRAESPDLILTDLRMPEMDGFELLCKVREENADVPVIIISGIGTMQDVIEALRRGAWDYLAKPIEDMGFLHHAVEKALERASLVKVAKGYQELLEKT